MSDNNLTWGYSLWDQYDRILEHTDAGLEFTNKCSHYVKDRVKVEIDYIKSLRNLRKKYKLKNAEENEFNNFTTVKSYCVILEQLELIAREHEIFAERLEDEVHAKLRALHKDVTLNRKNLCNTGSQLQQGYQQQQDFLEKARQKYEKMAREAEAAGMAFKKVNEDMNVSRAQLEKSRNTMNTRQDIMEKAKGDYIIQIEKTNNYQHDYYLEKWPSLLNQMQKAEESRIDELGTLLKQQCILHGNVLPQIKQCVDAMISSCDKVNSSQDSDLLMEERNKQPYPPDHVFIEYGSKQVSNFSSNPSMRKTKKERKKTKVNKEDLDHLPPEKRKKAFKEKIKEIESKIQIELKARQGLEDILELYSQKPELGSATAMEESRQQLDAITKTLEKLQEELYKYQCYLAALDDKPAPERPHIGSHLDSLSITSSNSHISHNHNDNDSGSGQGSGGGGDLPPPYNAAPPPEFSPASPTGEFNTDSFYEVPDNNNLPPNLNSCTVLYDYAAQHSDELDIFAGETLYVVEDNGAGWVKAQRNENEVGLIPGNYIEMLS